jgi:hypothetical protein
MNEGNVLEGVIWGPDNWMLPASKLAGNRLGYKSIARKARILLKPAEAPPKPLSPDYQTDHCSSGGAAPALPCAADSRPPLLPPHFFSSPFTFVFLLIIFCPFVAEMTLIDAQAITTLDQTELTKL